MVKYNSITQESIHEMGTASELTQGGAGYFSEGRPRPGWQKQVIHIGAATEITLGSGGNFYEGLPRQGVFRQGSHG